MFKKEARSRSHALNRIVSSILLVSFILGASACGGSGGGSSTAAVGVLPQPSVNCGGSSCIE